MRNTSVQSVERAGTILMYLADHPSASLRELADAIGCSRTTAHRLLNALAKSDLIAMRGDGKPTFGPAVARLYGAWCRQTELSELAYPYMLELRARSGETVTLQMQQGDAIVCVESVESPQPIGYRVYVGDVAPPFRSSSSKLVLAALPPSELAAVLDRLNPADRELRAQLAAELPLIREQGYATAYERFAGAASVAAPIWNSAGQIVGTVTIAGPADRVTPAAIAEMAPVLRDVAQSISERLGYVAAGTSTRPLPTRR